MEVMNKLEEIYPKLKGGGFEILRSAVKNEMAVVTPPVPFLRDQSGLAQAIAYILEVRIRIRSDRIRIGFELNFYTFGSDRILFYFRGIGSDRILSLFSRIGFCSYFVSLEKAEQSKKR